MSLKKNLKWELKSFKRQNPSLKAESNATLKNVNNFTARCRLGWYSFLFKIEGRLALVYYAVRMKHKTCKCK